MTLFLRQLNEGRVFRFQVIIREKDHLLESHLLEKSARHQNLDCSTPSLEHLRHSQVRLGQVTLGQVRLRQVRLGYVRLGQGRLGKVIGHVRLGQVLKSFCVSSRCHFSCRADAIFHVEQLRNCRAVKIRAVAIRAVDPDS